jgi:acyl carrier protein
MPVKDRIRQFIGENFYIADLAQLGDDTALIDGGYVDSTGMLELIAFLEHAFGIKIADTEMIPDNLGSIEKIAEFVDRKDPRRVA